MARSAPQATSQGEAVRPIPGNRSITMDFRRPGSEVGECRKHRRDTDVGPVPLVCRAAYVASRRLRWLFTEFHGFFPHI